MKSTDIWRSGGGFGRRIFKVGKGAQVENLLFYSFFCASVDVGRFLDLNNTPQAWDSPTFREFCGLIFPTKWTFEPTVFLLKKAARCHPFLAAVRCLFHNHLRFKRSNLLNEHGYFESIGSGVKFHFFSTPFTSTCRMNMRVGAIDWYTLPICGKKSSIYRAEM